MQTPVIDAVANASSTVAGTATDWAEYAESICATFDEHTGWQGG